MMERMNQDIPGEHQMLFIIKDYDRKVGKVCVKEMNASESLMKHR